MGTRNLWERLSSHAKAWSRLKAAPTWQPIDKIDQKMEIPILLNKTL
jgi:hypothetical protein